MIELKIIIDDSKIKRWGGFFIPGFTGVDSKDKKGFLIKGIQDPSMPGFEFEIPKEGNVFTFIVSPYSNNEQSEKPCFYCNGSNCNSKNCNIKNNHQKFVMFDGAKEYCKTECGRYEENKECKFKIDCAVNKFRNAIRKVDVDG